MNQHSYPRFQEIAASYSHFLLDMWGVVHNGVEALPGAINTLEELKKAGKKILFITNSSRPHTSLSDLITKMGIIVGKHYDYIHSSGDAVIEGLNDSQNDLFGKPYYYLGDTLHGHPLLPHIQAKQVSELTRASYILFTALTPHTDEILNQALSLNLVLVCANPDVVAMHGNSVSYCPGLAAQKYQQEGGTVIYYGKPYPPIYESALKKLGMPELQDVLAVGDGLYTDIKGANVMGIDSVLVLGGIHREEEPEKLEKLFTEEEISPNYIIPSFSW